MPDHHTYEFSGPCLYPSRVRSICLLLDSRQRGYVRKRDKFDFFETATAKADRELVNQRSVTYIDAITPEMRSTFLITCSNDGSVYTSHSNRSISRFSYGQLHKSKFGIFDKLTRTAWTIAVHPTFTNLVAIGTLNGRVYVYRNSKILNERVYVSDSAFQCKVGSMTFHPNKPTVLCFSLNCKLVAWDWKQNAVIFSTVTRYEKIKYVRFNPKNAMLVTGVESFKYNFYMAYKPRDDCGAATSLLLTIFHVLELSLQAENIDGLHERVQYQKWQSLLESLRTWNKPDAVSRADHGPQENLGTFDITLQLIYTRIRRIQESIPNYYDQLNDIQETEDLNIDVELLKLREVVSVFRLETVPDTCFLPSSIDDADQLVEVFTRMNELIVFNLNYVTSSEFLYHENINDRIQVWPFKTGGYPDFTQTWRNVLTEASIHNDSTIQMSRCGTILASYRQLMDNNYQINVHSLDLPTLGARLFVYDHIESAPIVSLSISPSREYMVVGIRSTIEESFFLRITSPKWLHSKEENPENICTVIEGLRADYEEVSVINWIAKPGAGAIGGFNSYHMKAIGYGKRHQD